VNAEDIIEKYGIQVVSTSGDELRCLCPFHPDNISSFSLNIRKGKWICFAGCGQGDLISLIQKFEQCSRQKAIKIFNSGNVILSTVEKQMFFLNKENKKEDELKKIRLPSEFRLIEKESDCPKYLLNRLDFSTIKRFGLGICKTGQYKNRIIIPVKLYNEVYGFVARDYTQNEKVKRYLYPVNFKPSYILFNYDNIFNNSYVILVEGVFDCMKLVEYGYNVVCTFGAKISTQQLNLLLQAKNIRDCILCYDVDNNVYATGQHGTQKTLRRMYLLFNMSYIELQPGRDPDEYSKEEFYMLFQKRIPYNYISYNIQENFDTSLVYLNNLNNQLKKVIDGK